MCPSDGLVQAHLICEMEAQVRDSDRFKSRKIAVDPVETGGLHPFGGVGASGHGREGVRYAMEEMSQLKFTGIRLEGVRG